MSGIDGGLDAWDSRVADRRNFEELVASSAMSSRPLAQRREPSVTTLSR